jgi:hypothetical protein
VTVEDWVLRLSRAAECGSACLRDTWVTVPAEMRDELEGYHLLCKLTAMFADEESRRK